MSKPTLSLKHTQLQQRLGYRFSDLSLLSHSLTHRSAGAKNNERLEFLGDSLINHVVAHKLYLQFPDASEGQLSRLRAKLVRGTYLAQIAVQLCLGDDLVLGTGERKSGGRHRESILADALEAVAGAVLLDSNFDRASEVVTLWFGDGFDDLNLSDQRDAKTQLQEWLQGRGQPIPDYELLTVTGADHDQAFRVACRVATISEPVEGVGKSRKQAEQAAAEQILERLIND